MNRKNWPVTNLATATVKSMKTHKRKDADRYPTPPAATQSVLERLHLKPGALIGEPACGEGDLADTIMAMGFEVFASDLHHTGYGLGGIDFVGPDFFVVSPRLDAIVTNPPFNLADKFIRQAVKQAPKVALLLKSNFWHADKRVKLWDDCTPTAQIPVAWRLAFLEAERGKSPLMDCTWFIWDRDEPPLKDRPMRRPRTVVEIPERSITVHLARLRAAHERLAEALADE